MVVVLLARLVLARATSRLAGAVVGARGVSRKVAADYAVRSPSSWRSHSCRKIGVDIPKGLRLIRLEPGHPATARRLHVFRRACPDLRPSVRFHRAPVVRTRWYIELGVYIANIAITIWGWSFAEGDRLHARACARALFVLGFVSLRVTGSHLAMVTLAFAQVGAVLVRKEPPPLDARREGSRRELPQDPAHSSGS